MSATNYDRCLVNDQVDDAVAAVVVVDVVVIVVAVVVVFVVAAVVAVVIVAVDDRTNMTSTKMKSTEKIQDLENYQRHRCDTAVPRNTMVA